MSAFVVDHKTIDRVLSFFFDAARDRDYERRQANKLLNEIEWSLDDLTDLGQAMLNMNMKAVGQRYPDTVSADGTIHEDQWVGCIDECGKPYKFNFQLCSKVQSFKSLQCWLYQCAEGDVTESKQWDIWWQIEAILARRIVCELPSYDSAQWG